MSKPNQRNRELETGVLCRIWPKTTSLLLNSLHRNWMPHRQKKVHERRKLQVAKTLLFYPRCYRCGLAEHLSMICKVLTLTKKSSTEGTERRKANERGINRRERANMQYKLKVNCTLLKTFQIWKKGNGKWCDDKYARAFRFSRSISIELVAKTIRMGFMFCTWKIKCIRYIYHLQRCWNINLTLLRPFFKKTNKKLLFIPSTRDFAWEF